MEFATPSFFVVSKSTWLKIWSPLNQGHIDKISRSLYCCQTLTIYHTLPIFNDSVKEPFWNIVTLCEKRENAGTHVVYPKTSTNEGIPKFRLVVFKWFQFRKGLSFVFRYWVKDFESLGIQLNPFPNKPWFLRACSTSLLKTLWEREKLFVTSNFSLSHRVFYRFRELSAIFIRIEIVFCILFQFQ